MTAMNMVSAGGGGGGVSGVSFHLSIFPQGVASVFCKKTPIFGSRGSKLDHLTVFKSEKTAGPHDTFALDDRVRVDLWFRVDKSF